MNIIEVVVTPQAPINVEAQTQTTNVQIGTDAALGAVVQGVADLHDKIDNIKLPEIDTSKIESAIADVKQAVEDIPAPDLSSVESAIADVKTAVESIEIDTTDLAKEFTLNTHAAEIKTAIANIPTTDLTEVAKESTLLAESEAIKQAIANAKPEIDTSELAKQGDNPEATNSRILEEIGNVATALTAINDTLGTL